MAKSIYYDYLSRHVISEDGRVATRQQVRSIALSWRLLKPLPGIQFIGLQRKKWQIKKGRPSPVFPAPHSSLCFILSPFFCTALRLSKRLEEATTHGVRGDYGITRPNILHSLRRWRFRWGFVARNEQRSCESREGEKLHARILGSFIAAPSNTFYSSS